MNEHRLIVCREIQRKSGFYLSWECNLRRCDARGNMTVLSREKALELMRVLDDGHREENDGD